MNPESEDRNYDAPSLIKLTGELDAVLNGELARRYQKYFGKSMEFLISDGGFVRAFADHPDPEYRNLAFCFLVRHGKSTEATKVLLMRKAREDPCEGVRGCAVTNLATIQKWTKDQEILRFLKSTVYDKSEHTYVRKAAYFGITYFDRYGNLMSFESFSFPDEVDWDYLESLAPGEDQN